jgi:hypothetical protein
VRKALGLSAPIEQAAAVATDCLLGLEMGREPRYDWKSARVLLAVTFSISLQEATHFGLFTLHQALLTRGSSACCDIALAAAGYNVVHPGDVSLMTYRGHAVLQTLIRAYFSPAHTTGQRYIYAGSAEGVINAWDVVSGKPVSAGLLNICVVWAHSWGWVKSFRNL